MAATVAHAEFQESPAVQLSVSDTGAGIPPELQSRVFDHFFTTKDQGTGLGLAIVHALVEAHQGRIDVESSSGHGTSFVITLPRGPRQNPAMPTSAPALTGRSRKSGRIVSITEEEMYE